jgi:hypothetical protein
VGLSHSPKIVTNGLVLCLDAANSKSKGYNVIASPENLGAYLGLRAGASISANSTAAPDGTQTADLLSTTDIVAGFGYYFPAFPTGNATHSFFLKPAGATNSFTFNHVGLARGGTFTFSTRTFSSLSNYTGSYEVLSNGWYLVNFHTTTEINIYYIEMSFDNISGAYVWGLQLTPFNYYLPYVPVSANRPQFLDNTMWQDLTGNGNTGTLTNGPTFSGANGGSLVFDGIDDYVSVTMLNPFAETIIVWVKSTTSNWDDVGWITSSRTQNGHIIHPNTDSKNVDFYVFDQNSTYFYMGSYTVEDITIPHMYCYSTNGSNLHKAYLDGAYKLQSTTAVTRTATPSNQVTQVGKDHLQSRYGNASIYSVIRYNRQLSDVEIQQNFNAFRGRYGI